MTRVYFARRQDATGTAIQRLVLGPKISSLSSSCIHAIF